jgi:hypothetical protein
MLNNVTTNETVGNDSSMKASEICKLNAAETITPIRLVRKVDQELVMLNNDTINETEIVGTDCSMKERKDETDKLTIEDQPVKVTSGASSNSLESATVTYEKNGEMAKDEADKRTIEDQHEKMTSGASSNSSNSSVSAMVTYDKNAEVAKDEADKLTIEEQHNKVTSGVSSSSLDSATVTYNKKAEIPTKLKRLRKAPIARSDDFLW